MPRQASRNPPSDVQLADALHSAAIHLLRRLRREDASTGLSPARLSALSVVVFGGPLRISELARAEQVRVPTITPIVAALEDAGLITRETDPADARAWVLRSTPRGEKLMAEGRLRRVASLVAALHDVSAADRRVLERAAPLIESLGRGGPS